MTRSHANSKRRTTNAVRAFAACAAIWGEDIASMDSTKRELGIIQRAIQAAVRQALARERARGENMAVKGPRGAWSTETVKAFNKWKPGEQKARRGKRGGA